jgi:chemotaxis response regulator CheB
VREGASLAGHAPQVLIVNLEPGVEDDLDALQELLDDPGTAVVFNEGEVSSQLTGWDLARWARHLAAKVLGVRDTLPPPPTGAERLPDLALVPEPGRPTSPSQQNDHLQFDDYAEEALGHSDEVPTSPRLELEATGHAPELPGFDFDFSPVQAGDAAAEAIDAAAPPAAEADTLESLDLSTLFEQDIGQLSPEDMLRKLQQVMGLDPGPAIAAPVPVEDAEPVLPAAATEAHAPFAQNEVFDSADPAAQEALSPIAELASSAPTELAFDWDLALEPVPEVHSLANPESPTVEPALEDASESMWDFTPAQTDVPAQLTESMNEAAQDVAVSVASELSFDPVEFEFGLDDASTSASRTTPVVDEVADPLALVDDSLAEFDFGSLADDTQELREPARASDRVEADAFSADAAGVGDALDFVASEDDDEVLRLAAELDARSSLPATADLPDLEFDFSLREPESAGVEPEAVLPQAPPAARTAGTPAAVPQAPAVAAPAGVGFGELSLQPMNDGFIDPGVKASEAPVRDFDFSHLTLSLEPLEDEQPPVPAHAQDDIAVATMRDGAWLRDIGEHDAGKTPPVSAASRAPTEVESATPTAEETPVFDFTPTPTAVPPPLPAVFSAPAPAFASTPAQSLPPLAQGVSRVVVLCASIGGPDAVRGFLAGIPAGFPALFVIVQHLENGYFERLAQQLQKASKLPVRVPMAGLSARDGEVLVVASGSRFLLAQDGEVDLAEQEQPSRYRPCIDEVLVDIADAFGPHAHAIIFSGMAADAVEGSVYLTRQGGEVWAQDPESCVVSSMVDGARARGVVEFVGSPRELAEHCVRRFGSAN